MFYRKKQAKKTKTGDPFVDGLDLDALLDQEISLKQKHEERSARLDELRMSNEEEASLMTEYNEKLAENVKLLQTDGHLFNSDLSRKDLSNETYGFVFQPIQEVRPVHCLYFHHTPTALSASRTSDLQSD